MTQYRYGMVLSLLFLGAAQVNSAGLGTHHSTEPQELSAETIEIRQFVVGHKQCDVSQLRIDKGKIARFFIFADPSETEESSKLSCYVEGSTVRMATSCQWRVRADMTGSMTCGDVQTSYVCNTDECEAIFPFTEKVNFAQ
ncbi:hypothetical protein [Thaumasiovibrio sp. DFM-14]|uniref:hypothetical protein n=1 Tax=Thaumasiovibrio sp. DFM-14 TaxID=3384792 RepID=UPI0039A19AF8